MAKSFVKAIYDYDSNEAEDLSFKAGAVIRVVDCVDDNWIKGEHNGKVGLFPGNFVEPTFTGFDAAETTIVAKETYISGEDGVLTFFRGDRITFLGFVDDYWCRGRFGSEVGLFPAFAVDGLDELSSIPANKTSAETTPTGNQESNILPRENNGEPCAESLYEFKGLSSDELSFPAGEIILLSKDIDLEWFEGSHNGKTGLFPKSFVNVLKPLIKVPSTNVPETPVPYAVAVYPYVGETSTELSFREGDIIYLHCWVSPEWIEGEINGKTGIFPSSFVQIQVELPHEFQDYSNCKAEWLKRNGVKDSGIEQTENSSFKVGDKAVAIYSFSTNVKGDLSLEVGDLINIERIIDDEWIEGRRNDAEVGLCPAVFLELQEGISKSSPETERSNLAGRSEISTSTRAMPNQPESYPCTEIMNNSIKMGNIASIDSEIETLNICSADQNPLLNVTQSTSQITKTSSAQILDDANMTKHSVTSRKIITGGITGDDNNVSEKPTATKPLPSPKPAITAKPSILPKPAFLKNTQKPVTVPETLNSNKVVERENVVSLPPSVLPSDHPGEAVGQNINATPEKLGVVGKIEQNSSTQENDLEAKQQKATADGHVHPLVYNRVMFEDQEESYSPTIQTVSNLGTTSLQKTSNHSSNLAFSPRNVPPDESHNSCKSLFDESLDDGLPPPLHPKPIFGENPPEPPPRLDLLCSKHSEGSTSDALSSKLAQQADEFEKSHHPKKSSPSLNELRAASQKSNVQRPVPARRNKPPSSLSSHHIDIDPGKDKVKNGFPIFDELDEQIAKLNEELQKESKVLSGVEVLIQKAYEDTARKEEYESKKGITERKIEDLRRQRGKAEGKKDHLAKLLAGYSSQLEVKLKTEQLQDGIKENIETRNNLQSLLSDCEDDETAKDLKENILFCDEAIKNLNAELQPLMDVLVQLEGLKESSQELEKDVKFRKKVIDEILETERSFGSDLNLCVKHFMKQLIEWKVDSVDCDLLFGNMPEVAALSSRLLQKLETAAGNINIHDQIIGTCFVDFSDEITKVYGRYCRNHDDAIAFIEKSANNEEIQQYFRKCMESVREYSSCWDLSSFLIKPVQRVLKYPLLLNELLKNTPNEHPDKEGLTKAVEVMTVAANDVNEFKRRKDLVQKYQKVEDSGLSTMFQKLTWHSLVKKSSRFNQRITQRTGFVSQTVDKTFNEKEQIFYHIEKTVKSLIKNTTQYVDQFEEVHTNQLQTAENIVDFYQNKEDKEEVKEYHNAQKYIGENLVNELKQVLDAKVLSPLVNLMQLFQGPHRLIQKRHDKCLDYDSWANKIDKIKDRDKWKQANEELELAKKNYEALNIQLLDELPILNSKAFVVLQTCIANFANAHKNFFVEAFDRFSPSVQLSVVNSKGGDMSDFFSRSKLATHEVFQLTFTPKKYLTAPKPMRPNVRPVGLEYLSPEEKPLKSKSLRRSGSERKRRAPLPPSDSGGLVRSRTVSVRDRSLLHKREVGTRVITSSEGSGQRSDSGNENCVVKFTFKAEAPEELSVNKGDIVKVLQYHDSLGNSEWWKVNHAGQTGYVPSNFLTAQTTSHVAKSGSSNGTLMNSATEFVARYDFEARSSIEVSLAVGDVVRVLERHDPSGNHEWWSVEVNGQHGYVPASFLAKR